MVARPPTSTGRGWRRTHSSRIRSTAPVGLRPMLTPSSAGARGQPGQEVEQAVEVGVVGAELGEGVRRAEEDPPNRIPPNRAPLT